MSNLTKTTETPPTEGHEEARPRLRKLTGIQRAVLAAAVVPMLAVGVAGGIGTYSNLGAKYGDETALGALAAGEGATAVLALVLLVTTLLGQSAPLLVRVGLWALPAAAALMGATAADGLGQTIVFALTPMAITAAAEGVAFLSRRVVIHQEGRDIEAEARAAAIVRDLAYHQARAAGHPDARKRKASEKKAWKLAARVGSGDVRLGADLMDIQRDRIGAGANAALERMFGGTASTMSPALPAASADTRPALPAASTADATNSRAQESTIRTDTDGRPNQMGSDQQEDTESVRPDLKIVGTEQPKKKSIRADVFGMVANGVQDVSTVLDAIATRHKREADDPALKSTVHKYVREAAQASAKTSTDDAAHAGQYL
ncbi:conjugal transfer protein [Streptomyces cyaneofuscatus]|uniref:conjugal transfer protein n=1 Tax=Streptomyces cyaneofuscatus TaxID=66883 RepID=UPI0033BB5A9E